MEQAHSALEACFFSLSCPSRACELSDEEEELGEVVAVDELEDDPAEERTMPGFELDLGNSEFPLEPNVGAS